MAKKLNENAIIPDETQGITPEVTGDETETPAETNTEESTPNAEWAEIVSQYAPGTDTSNPQSILDAMLPVVQKMITMEGKIKDACSTSPETASFMSDVIDGLSVPKSFARNFSPEERQALNDEVGDDQYEEDRNSFNEKVKATKDRETQVKGNQDISIAEISSFYEEKGWSEQQADEFSQKVESLIQDVLDGKITKEHLTVLDKGFNRDSDVATAEENGKIIGKNEKIVSGKKTRNDIKDLLPEGGVDGAATPVKKETYAQSLNSTSPLKKLNI